MEMENVMQLALGVVGLRASRQYTYYRLQYLVAGAEVDII